MPLDSHIIIWKPLIEVELPLLLLCPDFRREQKNRTFPATSPNWLTFNLGRFESESSDFVLAVERKRQIQRASLFSLVQRPVLMTIKIDRLPLA
jgi:hypothetical protein